MFGNLFNQHKPEDTVPVAPAQSAAPTAPTDAPAATPAPGAPAVVGSTMDPTRRQDLSALTHLDPRTMTVLSRAQQEATRIKQQFIEPEQLLYGLLFDEQIFKLLEGLGSDNAKLTQDLQAAEKTGTFQSQPTLSEQSKQVFEVAYRGAKAREVNFIYPEDLVAALFSASPSVSGFLQAHGVQKAQFDSKMEKTGGLGTGKKSVLDMYGIDLTQQAREGKLDPVAGRDKEIDRLVHILLRRTKNNPIIIGEAGVGKTAIVEGMAQAIVNGTAPKDLANKRIVQLDVASIVAGASHRGEFEERLRNVINETMNSAGQVILFIDEIHVLMGAGDNGDAMNASNIIKPHLARGHLQIIGATTTSEYRKNFEKDKAFERRFQPIVAEEPSIENAIAMMKVLKSKYETFHHVTIPDDTLEQAVKLSKKYIGERYLPDKAVDLLDEGAAEVKLAVTSGKRTDSTVLKSDIENVVSIWTGIPITKLTEDEGKKLLNLEDRIHQRLIDQEEAVVAVSEAVRRGRIGLASGNRPIASFIFLGSSGVGKTELAKTIAEILFGKDDAMIRLDMSEYMEKHEVAKLIGAPPGYVGYEEGGQLTEAVRAKPYSIVLLDEVEKAHPDVFNILLQVLEDGRLTDNKGNTISFKNTIVICTSNIGSALITQQLSDSSTAEEAEVVKDPKLEAKPNKASTPAEDATYKELTTTVTAELRKFFRPELLNRFDDIVIFKPLRRQDMKGIAKLGIAKTGSLLKEQGYAMTVSDKALAQMAKEGYDPVYGARPLRRLIQTSIENPIALLIIGKTFVPGDTIGIDYDATKAQFVFAKAAAPAVDSVNPAAPQDGTAIAPTSTAPVQPSVPVDPNAPQSIAPQSIAPIPVEVLQSPVAPPVPPLIPVASIPITPEPTTSPPPTGTGATFQSTGA